MSDQKKRPTDAQVVQRYGRRGGSARKDPTGETPSGFWQRVFTGKKEGGDLPDAPIELDGDEGDEALSQAADHAERERPLEEFELPAPSVSGATGPSMPAIRLEGDPPLPPSGARRPAASRPPASAPPGGGHQRMPPSAKSLAQATFAPPNVAATIEGLPAVAPAQAPSAAAVPDWTPKSAANAERGRRLAVELVLPDGKRLLLLGRSKTTGGVLPIDIEPAPGNDASLLAGLSLLARRESESVSPADEQAAAANVTDGSPAGASPGQSTVDDFPDITVEEPDAPQHRGPPGLDAGTFDDLPSVKPGPPAADDIILDVPTAPSRLEPDPHLPPSGQMPAVDVHQRVTQKHAVEPANLPPEAVARSRARPERSRHVSEQIELAKLAQRSEQPLELESDPPPSVVVPPPDSSPRRRGRVVRGGAAAHVSGETEAASQPPAALAPPAASPPPSQPAPETEARTPAPPAQEARPARPKTGEGVRPLSPIGRHAPPRRAPEIVGIDFGTTFSSVAVLSAGLEPIADPDGEFLTPSVVSFPRPGEIVVGSEARRRMGGEAQWTISSPKRLLGRAYKDPHAQSLLGPLALRTFAGTDKLIRFDAHGQIYSVIDVCSMILSKLRERACRHLGLDVRKAVFAVPVAFGSLQRSALEAAARQAGLQGVAMLTEPSAALLAHGFRGRSGLAAVYDFGGGTFDFCVVEVTETSFSVVCAGGDPWLGGDDLDNAIATHLADCFWNDTGVDLRQRAVEWQALLFACEEGKRQLSTRTSAVVRVDDILHTAQGRKGLAYKISQKGFIQLVKHLVDRSINVAERVLAQGGIAPKRVDTVVLTGGTSMIPYVRERVTELFGKKPIVGDATLAVVRGTALRAAELAGEAVAETSLGGRTLREVSGRTIGVGTSDGQVLTLFERDTPLPAEVSRVFHTTEAGQTEMRITLYEGEKSRLDERQILGQLRYKGLSPAPLGQGKVEFTFILDEDGMLHVTAVVEGKIHNRTIKLK